MGTFSFKPQPSFSLSLSSHSNKIIAELVCEKLHAWVCWDSHTATLPNRAEPWVSPIAWGSVCGFSYGSSPVSFPICVHGSSCGGRTECHSPGPEEGYPKVHAAEAGAGRRHSAHQLVVCVEDVPSDLSWGEAHRGQEEAQRLWHPESR